MLNTKKSNRMKASGKTSVILVLVLVLASFGAYKYLKPSVPTTTDENEPTSEAEKTPEVTEVVEAMVKPDTTNWKKLELNVNPSSTNNWSIFSPVDFVPESQVTMSLYYPNTWTETQDDNNNVVKLSEISADGSTITLEPELGLYLVELAEGRTCFDTVGPDNDYPLGKPKLLGIDDLTSNSLFENKFDKVLARSTSMIADDNGGKTVYYYGFCLEDNGRAYGVGFASSNALTSEKKLLLTQIVSTLAVKTNPV